MSAEKTNQSWGGRFSEPVDAFVARFTASVDFDKRLYRHDIMGSIAHATMLAKVGVLSDAERDTIIDGLQQIQGEIEAGQFDWRVDLEDVHMNIEARLTERVGITGKKLHTGRSRNDQVATDIRLWLRDEIDTILAEITRLQQGLLGLAEAEADTIMPGFTHLQTAQPVTFGHHLLAWFEMLSRDYERLVDCRKRVNRMPLGSAALAGTTYPIQREITCALLGFDAVGGNSLDGVSDRDFAIEFCAAASLAMMHLSRFSEELVLWTSAQFQFIDLPDRCCTGSSIMPQKKNPVVLEYLKGRTGHIVGLQMAANMTVKGTNFTHSSEVNREGTRDFWEAAEESLRCLKLLELVLRTATPNVERGLRLAAEDFSTATGLADLIVRDADLSFREAHHIVGAVVRQAMDAGEHADQITGAMIDAAAQEQLGHPLGLDEEKVRECLAPVANVQARRSPGAPGRPALDATLEAAQARLTLEREAARLRRERQQGARSRLDQAIRALAER